MTETKRCQTCKTDKEVTTDNYGRLASSPDGHQPRCKACTKAANKKWSKTDKGKATGKRAMTTYRVTDKSKAAQKKYNESEKGKTFRAAHDQLPKTIATRKAYRETEEAKAKRRAARQTEQGKATSNAVTTIRRARAKCELTVEERRAVTAIHKEAQRLTRETGIPMHVDHIKPVAKGGVSHPDNLQILTAEENMKKSDKYKGE